MADISDRSLGQTFSTEEVRRIYVLFSISLIGILTLIPIGILILTQKNLILGVLDLLLASVLTANLFHARYYKNYKFNIQLAIFLVAALFVYSFFTIGYSQGAFVWYYIFPLLASFLLGSKKGSVATIFIFLPAIALFLVKIPPPFFSNFTFHFKMRFVLSFLIVSIFSYLFQNSQERSQEELQKSHDNLEKRIREQTLTLQEAVQKLQCKISGHKQMEETLQESERKYRTILENIEDGYFEVDIAGNVTFCNDSMCQIWGYPKEELIGKNYRDGTDQENANKLYQTFNKVYRTGIPNKAFDYGIIRKDGTKIHIDTSVSLKKDSSGNPIGFKGILRDITERKQTEEERDKLILQLQDALAKVKKLSGLIPICSSCKKIRDDKGYWKQIEVYIIDHSEADFTHGICPDCMEKLYPNL